MSKYFSNSETGENYTFSVNNIDKKHTADVTIKIEGVSVDFLVDSGSTVNILDKSTLDELLKHHNIQVQSCNFKLYGYASSAPLQLMGTIHCLVEARERIDVAKFVIVKDRKSGNILGRDTAVKLDLLSINGNEDSSRTSHEINNISPNSSTTTSELPACVKEYEHVFHGVGNLKNREEEEDS